MHQTFVELTTVGGDKHTKLDLVMCQQLSHGQIYNSVRNAADELDVMMLP